MSCLVSWQQFFGLTFAWLCSLLRVKRPNLNNVEVLHVTFDDDMLRLMARASVVAISTDDVDVSSGQLVALQAMALGKAVVATRSAALDDYIDDGERSVQYKGSDGKFHGIAPDGGNTAQSYAVVNNPHAYELVFSGQYVGGGHKKFNAYTCDEARTEISASELVDIIVADPNTTIIFRTKGSGRIGNLVQAVGKYLDWHNVVVRIAAKLQHFSDSPPIMHLTNPSSPKT